MRLDPYRAAERLMSMDDATWARHANPWSVATRFTGLPLVALAIWSRDWIGPWSLAALAAALVWIWLNPRLFPAPRSAESWAARGVMGERMFLARARRPVPAHHVRMAHALTAVSCLGLAVLAYGLFTLRPAPALWGLTVAIGAKAWFADRMVWLQRDAERVG